MVLFYKTLSVVYIEYFRLSYDSVAFHASHFVFSCPPFPYIQKDLPPALRKQQVLLCSNDILAEYHSTSMGVLYSKRARKMLKERGNTPGLSPGASPFNMDAVR